MRYSVFLLFILYALLFISCASFRKTADYPDRAKLSSGNISQLDGNYRRYSGPGRDSVQSDIYYNFSNLISGNLSLKKKFLQNPEKDYVSLKFYDKNRLKVIFYRDTIQIREKTLHYKLKDDYCEIRRKYLYLPAAFINVFRTRKFRIALNNDGNLVTDFREIAFGTYYLVIPFFNKVRQDNIIFERRR